MLSLSTLSLLDSLSINDGSDSFRNIRISRKPLMMETVTFCETLGLYTILDDGDSKNFRNTGNVHHYLMLLTMTSFQNAGCPSHLDSLPEEVSLHILAVKFHILYYRKQQAY
jgi:hypothetical protein